MKLQTGLIAKGLVTITLLWAPLSFADWSLDSERSNISFVTTKATHIAEVNGFDRLQGSIDEQGKATLNIDLSSVNTAIEIRDERVQEHLFEVGTYPEATVSANVDIKSVNELASGAATSLELNGTLDLHGVSLPVSAEVTVVKTQNQGLLVFSETPLVINASSVDLAGGVEKLREIAGLPNISLSVTVSFKLAFTQS